MHEENSNSQNVNFTITSCQRGASEGIYKIYLEDGSSFFLSVDFFLEHKIRKDLTIDEDLYKLIIEESQFVEAYSKAISLLRRQLYTKFNLTNKLLSKEYSEEGIKKAIEYLENQGYINDEQYSEKYVLSRLKSKLDSYNGLLSKLINKGISSNIAKETLKKLYTEEVNEEIIKKSIAKMLSSNKDKEKIISSLVRKGFRFNLIKKLMEEI